MGFSERQVNALQQELDERFVHSREAHGRTLSYIEGGHAISEANRIFGFDGWDRETVETKCVLGRESRSSCYAVYHAKVRVTAHAEDRIVIREGYGTGEAQGGSVGETHEKALKTAETDATKRALATFGNPFGLSHYVSKAQPRERTFNPVSAPPIEDEHRRRTAQALGAGGRYYVPARPKVPIDPDLVNPPEAVEGIRAKSRTSDEADGADKADESVVPHTAPLAQNSAMERGIASDPPERVAKPDDRAGTAKPDDSLPQTKAPSLQPEADTGADTAETQKAELQQLLIDWPKRRREPDHLEYVRSQPCVLCGRTPSDAHHLKFGQPRSLGRKVSDEFTVPLSRTHHRQLHLSGKEVDWWETANPGVDALQIAGQLWEESRSKKVASGEAPKDS
jgi:hypothetical protein